MIVFQSILLPQISGFSRRKLLIPSKAYLVLSEIHVSLIFSFNLGKILTILSLFKFLFLLLLVLFLVCTTILLPKASEKSIEFMLFSSQLLPKKAYGFEVNAPTGHKSTKLPESSVSIYLLT